MMSPPDAGLRPIKTEVTDADEQLRMNLNGLHDNNSASVYPNFRI